MGRSLCEAVPDLRPLVAGLSRTPAWSLKSDLLPLVHDPVQSGFRVTQHFMLSAPIDFFRT